MKNINNILQSDIEKVNEIILSRLESDEELVETVSKYLINSGGKRIRPALTILCSKLFCFEGDEAIKLAASVEFIHAATLLHDDVVDSSTKRRFKDTANVIWGNQTSILVGDFLFSQSFKLMVGAGSMPALQILADALAVIVEGEVRQLVRLSEKRMVSREEYDQIINAKTARLFGAACEVGCIISGQNEKTCGLLRDFGVKLGFIFQISDDLLDYFGTSDIGKNIGDDFAEGKITLPVIMAYNSGSDEEKAFWHEALFGEDKDAGKFQVAVNLLKKHKVAEALTDYMDKLIKEGESYLHEIEGDEVYKGHLISLLRYAASRES